MKKSHFSEPPLDCSISVIRLKDGSTPYHNHKQANQHEVIFALSGGGILKTAGKEEEVREGDIIYVSPGDNHQLQSRDASIVIACVHVNALERQL